jgi:hypothetical protein
MISGRCMRFNQDRIRHKRICRQAIPYDLDGRMMSFIDGKAKGMLVRITGVSGDWISLEKGVLPVKPVGCRFVIV